MSETVDASINPLVNLNAVFQGLVRIEMESEEVFVF